MGGGGHVPACQGPQIIHTFPALTSAGSEGMSRGSGALCQVKRAQPLGSGDNLLFLAYQLCLHVNAKQNMSVTHCSHLDGVSQSWTHLNKM